MPSKISGFVVPETGLMVLDLQSETYNEGLRTILPPSYRKDPNLTRFLDFVCETGEYAPQAREDVKDAEIKRLGDTCDVYLGQIELLNRTVSALRDENRDQEREIARLTRQIARLEEEKQG